MPTAWHSFFLKLPLVVLVAFFTSTPAWSTADTLHTVLVPIENWQRGGFCQRETVAGDSIGSLTELGIIRDVLSKPLIAHCNCYGKETIDLNPLTAEEPRLKIEIDEAGPAPDGSWGSYELINLRISAEGSPPKGEQERLETRLNVALLFGLKNIFAVNKCASVNVEIALDLVGGRTGRLSAPVAFGPGVYESLVRELTASDGCETGMPLTSEWKRVDREGMHCR